MNDREKRMCQKKWKAAKKKTRVQTDVGCLNPCPSEDGFQTQQCRHGRKKVKKERAKCYRDLKKVQEQLDAERRRSLKYKKCCERLKKTITNDPTTENGEKPTETKETPRSKTRRLLRNFKELQ
jgi:hypothetical protein